MIDQVFIQAQVERKMILEAQFTAVIASMIAQGLGIGLIDPFTAADFRDRGVAALRFEPKIRIVGNRVCPSCTAPRGRRRADS